MFRQCHGAGIGGPEAAVLGVYVYYAWVVFLDGERVLFSGDVVVLR
jgi:hypothetical protein